MKARMTTDYIELRNHLYEMPGPMTGFARLHKKAVEDGALSGKVNEQIEIT